MGNDIAVLAKQNLFQNVHDICNEFLRDVRNQSQNNIPPGSEQDYAPPTKVETAFLRELSVFLHKECGIGTADDDADMLQHIANHDKRKNVGSYIRVHKNFMEKLLHAIYNPSLKGSLAWLEEKTEPAKTARLLEIYEHYVSALEPHIVYDPEGENSPALDFYRSMRIKFKELPHSMELFKSDSSQGSTGPITSENQCFNKLEVLPADHRAKVIYFGGMIKESEQPNFINRAMRRLKRAIDRNRIPLDQYDIYVVTYNNRATLQKTKNCYNYSLDPEHFHSDTATEIAQTTMRSLYADADGHKLPDDELFKRMSLVTLVGYSYGTTFIQELRNAMVEEMHKIGYDAETTKKALGMVAAFNFSGIAPIVDKRERGDFTQAHACADGDTTVYLRSNIHELTASDKNPILKQYRIKDAKGLHTLGLLGFGLPGIVRSYPTEAVDDELLSGMHVPGDPRNRIKVRVLKQVIERDDSQHHHIAPNYRLDGVRPDDDEMVERINPVAEFINRALRKQVKASVAVSNGGAKYRDAARINKEVANRILTPEMISTHGRESHIYRENLRRAAEEDGIPISTAAPND